VVVLNKHAEETMEIMPDGEEKAKQRVESIVPLHRRINPGAESRRRGADFRRRVHRAQRGLMNDGNGLH
jgi:hypothetical protein